MSTKDANQDRTTSCRDIEVLAAYAHDAWAGWMRYLFSHGTQQADGTFILDAAKVERWRRQMITPYADLSEAEKASDRKEAKAILAILGTVPDVRMTTYRVAKDQKRGH